MGLLLCGERRGAAAVLAPLALRAAGPSTPDAAPGRAARGGGSSGHILPNLCCFLCAPHAGSCLSPRSGKVSGVSANLEDEAPPSKEYDHNGVDRSLVRACLRDTPLECLQALEEMQQLAESVTRVGEPIPQAD